MSFDLLFLFDLLVTLDEILDIAFHEVLVLDLTEADTRACRDGAEVGGFN